MKTITIKNREYNEDEVASLLSNSTIQAIQTQKRFLEIESGYVDLKTGLLWEEKQNET